MDIINITARDTRTIQNLFADAPFIPQLKAKKLAHTA